MEDLSLLFRLPDLPSVQVFRADTASVEEFSTKLWPLQWLLARYHRKHSFASQRLPRSSEFINDVSNFVNEFHWAHHLKSQHQNDYEPRPAKLKSPGVPTKPCDKRLHLCLRAWTSQLRMSLARGFKQDVAASLAAPRRDMPVIRIAKRMLRSLGMLAIPRDKGGGFILVRTSDNAMLRSGFSTTGVAISSMAAVPFLV